MTKSIYWQAIFDLLVASLKSVGLCVYLCVCVCVIILFIHSHHGKCIWAIFAAIPKL